MRSQVGVTRNAIPPEQTGGRRALRGEHEAFQASLTALPDAPFPAYVHLIDRWRVLPYTDPGLPPAMLPADWPGGRSFEAFARLSAAWAAPALAHVRTVTA